jgi:ABC-type phosphate transport system substrate-binding protein
MVGSDTSQFVMEDLAALYNSKTPTPVRRMASFNASGSATITIRPGINTWRPNGSQAGINALCGSTNIDVARASFPKGASDCADSRFPKFATDQLRWAANTSSSSVTSLTDAQLTGIYNRSLYNVVKVAGSGVVPSYLSALFGNGSGANSTGGVPFVCVRSDSNPATTTAGDAILANGFLELPIGQCGRV